TPSSSTRCGWPKSRQIIDTRYPARDSARARMLCCTSEPPMISIRGSCENTGQAFGATKQICGRGKTLAGCNGGAPQWLRASAALRSRRLSMSPSLGILARDTRIAGVVAALAIHHSNRQPQEGLLRSRPEAAVGDIGDQKARQSGRCPEIEPPQGGAQGRIDAQRAKALPDVGEIGANDNQAGYPDVESGLQVRAMRM